MVGKGRQERSYESPEGCAALTEKLSYQTRPALLRPRQIGAIAKS